MPIRSKRQCTVPGCPHLTNGGKCQEHQAQAEAEAREYDKRRDQEQAHRAWYHSPRWRSETAAFKARNPLCAQGLREGHAHAGGQVDHIEAHKGDYQRFWDQSNWQNLCAHHHSVKTSKEGGRWGR